MKLPELPAGTSAEIVSVLADGALLPRLQMLNLSPGKRVQVLRVAPFGGSILLDAEGVRVALRRSLAAKIAVRPLPAEEGV